MKYYSCYVILKVGHEVGWYEENSSRNISTSIASWCVVRSNLRPYLEHPTKKHCLLLVLRGHRFCSTVKPSFVPTHSSKMNAYAPDEHVIRRTLRRQYYSSGREATPKATLWDNGVGL